MHAKTGLKISLLTHLLKKAFRQLLTRFFWYANFSFSFFFFSFLFSFFLQNIKIVIEACDMELKQSNAEFNIASKDGIS